jgi:hypothetical protein
MINIDPKKSLKTIIKYLLIVNTIYLCELLYFKLRGGVPFQEINLSVAIINILGLILYMIIKKYEPLFESVMMANKFARKIDYLAGKING